MDTATSGNWAHTPGVYTGDKESERRDARWFGDD
jgi:hypothetical protein